MMNVIAAHELVHACGPDDVDHGRDGLFNSPVSPSTGIGIVPEAGKNRMPMPQLGMDNRTIMSINKDRVGLLGLGCRMPERGHQDASRQLRDYSRPLWMVMGGRQSLDIS